MKIKGWSKETERDGLDSWENDWFPYILNAVTGNKCKNYVSVIVTPGGWYQVWASSSEYGEIGFSNDHSEAVKIAVGFMRKYPGGKINETNIIKNEQYRKNTKKYPKNKPKTKKARR